LRILEFLYELIVVLVGVLIYGISLIPGYFLIRWGHSAGFPYVVFTYPAAFYLFIVTLILVTGGIRTLFVPRLKPGTYSFSKDKHIYTWVLNRTITEYVFMPFSRVVITNDWLRYLCLRLYGVKLHYSSGISSSYISDFTLLSFGKNVVVGGWAVIYCHVEPEPGSLILGPVSVGDNTVIGARVTLSCGDTIGNDVILGFGVNIGVYSKVGDGCNIGIMVTLGHRTILEDNVKIGKYCSIGSGVKIRQGIKVPDGSIIPDFTVIDSQQQVGQYKIALMADARS
jgi:acetyltransferase-like isoleucine patch superfamily enzyme